jgi:hypothetical protein
MGCVVSLTRTWSPDLPRADAAPVARPPRLRASARLPLAIAAGCAIAAGAVLATGHLTLVERLVGLSLLGGGVGGGLVAAFRAGRAGMCAGLAMVAIAVCAIGLGASAPHHQQAVAEGAVQDGGVLATQGAARALLTGHDPYAVSLASSLGAGYQTVRAHGPGGHQVVVANPLRHYYPYLPGAFLLQVPGQFVAGTGGWFDPRWMYLGAVLLAALLIIGWPAPDWARGAALLGFANALLVLWCAYGSNDAAVASWVVVAALAAFRWPRAAGVALAVAVSYKFILVVAGVPLGVISYRRAGWAGLRRWWTFPATLGATVVPFLAWSPRPFVRGAVLFQLGMVPDKFPVSGIGLPVLFPGVFHGSVAKAGVLVFGSAGLALAGWLAWRWPRPEIVAPATAIALLGAFACADTFQTNYLVLLASLAGAGWLLAAPPQGGVTAAKAAISLR